MVAENGRGNPQAQAALTFIDGAGDRSGDADMHERTDASARRSPGMTGVAANGIETRQGGPTGASACVLGFSLVFAAAAFVLVHHFVMH